jgi:hypothetical protein
LSNSDMIDVAQKGVMKKVKDERGRHKNRKVYRVLDSIDNLLIVVVMVKVSVLSSH